MLRKSKKRAENRIYEPAKGNPSRAKLFFVKKLKRSCK